MLTDQTVNSLTADDGIPSLSAVPLDIAVHLPLHTFKNPATLKLALDRMRKNKNHLPSPMLHGLAKHIASTTATLNTDYGTMLELIAAAAEHRLFQPRNKVRLFVNFMTRGIYTKICRLLRLSPSAYLPYRSDNQKILDQARQNIMKRRDKIILC